MTMIELLAWPKNRAAASPAITTKISAMPVLTIGRDT